MIAAGMAQARIARMMPPPLKPVETVECPSWSDD
jgi:hypothetical protein